MGAFSLVAAGLGRARRHWGLVLVVYLASLLPALALVLPLAENFSDAFDSSTFAEELLGGNATGVWQDFSLNESNRMGPVLGVWKVAALFSLLLQIVLAAGTVSVLLEPVTGGAAAFFDGVRRHTGRFLRSLLAFGLVFGGIVLVFVAVTGTGAALTESTADERFRIGFFVGGLALSLLLLAPADLAYDLSRIAAVAHDGRQTFRGYFRALWAVLRRPFAVLPFYLVLVAILAAAHLFYLLVRIPWFPASMGSVLLLLGVQQGLMLFRAFLQTGFWGTEVTYYAAAGEPRWCGPKEHERLPFSEMLGIETPADGWALPDTEPSEAEDPELEGPEHESPAAEARPLEQTARLFPRPVSELAADPSPSGVSEPAETETEQTETEETETVETADKASEGDGAGSEDPERR